ncbi:MAG TPA: SBBP repeat-containing protein [Ignavibacteriaceae bacterium]|nr:SBBP repeat-containing protein [Ignavibacteriaceae bacterium]
MCLISASGAYQTILGGNKDAFITKLNLTGSGLIYSTFIGGNGNDYGNSIVIAGSGNAYITGYTQSSNYPTTSGGYLLFTLLLIIW